MNGPEHYREAEWLLRKYDQITDAGGDPGDTIATAQVHATLAQAAATIDGAYGNLSTSAWAAWAKVSFIDGYNE